MTTFIDASALVAMIAREPEARSFGERLKIEPDRLTSAVAIWEAVRAVGCAAFHSTKHGRWSETSPGLGGDDRADRAPESEIALDAHATYGRGVDPAELNMGDCFAYACTKGHDASILFTGDDFAQTDLLDTMLT